MSALEVASLASGILGALLALMAIGISFGFFLAGHRVTVESLKALGKIESSTHATETSAMPIINRMLELLSSGVTANLELGRVSLEEQVERILRSDPTTSQDSEAIDRLKKEILSELSTAFRSVEYKTSSMAPMRSEKRATEAVLDVSRPNLPPAVPRVIHWMAKHKGNYEYFAVNYLRNRIFRADPAAQEAVQFCIDTGMLALSKRDNPNNPDFPTTTCELNRDHPATREILADAHIR